MRVAIIPADLYEPVEIQDVDIDLAFLQGAVGGYIEMVSVTEMAGAEMVLDEEGKLKGKRLNARANALVILRPGDYVVGNVVLVGAADDNGYSTGLTDAQIEWLREDD